MDIFGFLDYLKEYNGYKYVNMKNNVINNLFINLNVVKTQIIFLNKFKFVLK